MVVWTRAVAVKAVRSCLNLDILKLEPTGFTVGTNDRCKII